MTSPRVLLAFFCILFSGLNVTLHAAQYHISPTGIGTGPGTNNHPWSLSYAFSSPPGVKPGDTLWIHGGTYDGQFVSQLNGTASLPIIVRQYPGERAVLNGGTDPQQRSILTVRGTYTWFWGFEIWSSELGRISKQTGSSPSDLFMGAAVGTAQTGSDGTGCKFINMYIHDTSQGFGLWVQAQDLEVYGCQILFNGWSASNAWGHAIYIQNQFGSKTVQDNLIYGNLGYGIHAYTLQTEYLNNLSVLGNTFVANGYDINAGQGKFGPLVGGDGLVRNLVFKNNCLYLADNVAVNTGATFGVPGSVHLDATIDSNCFVGGKPSFRFDGFESGSVRANMVVGNMVWAEFYPRGSVGGFEWDHNRYFGQSSGFSNTPFLFSGEEFGFGQWQAVSGKDRQGLASPSLPKGTQVFVRPNRYEEGRSHVTVYNWGNEASITVEAGKLGMGDGAKFELINVQNMDYVRSGTVSGGQVIIPMSGWSTPKRPNGTTTPVQDLLPRFGAFIVKEVLPQPKATLQVSPQKVEVGGRVTLIWSSEGAEAATIDPDFGSIGVNGSAVVTVDSSTTFTLTVVNRNASRSVSVRVTALKAPQGEFTAMPDTLPPGGGQVVLAWNSESAVAASIDHGIGPVALSGSMPVSVRATTDYTLLLTGALRNREYTARVVVSLPGEYALLQNYPNPFNNTTVIEFSLPVAENVELMLRDVLGRDVFEVAHQHFDAGVHRVTFSAAMFSSGVYFLTLLAGSFTSTCKMILIK
jgi:hypothetical protein